MTKTDLKTFEGNLRALAARLRGDVSHLTSEALRGNAAEAGTNQFGRRSVTLGESIKGQTAITSGVKPGERVIGDGSLFLQFANSLQR